MPLRFRRSIRIMPGVHLNIGKTGIGSISIGDFNIGKQGVFHTFNIHGTGLSYRLPLLSGSANRDTSGDDEEGSTAQDIVWALKDDGSLEFTDGQGGRIDDDVVREVKKQHKADIAAWLREHAEKFNQSGEALATLHLTTPPPAPPGPAAPNGEEAQSKLLSEAFSKIEWHTETTAAFDIVDDGQTVLLDVNLPEIEDMPARQASASASEARVTFKDRPKAQVQQDYLRHIHAIGFRLIGEVFARLPGVRTVVFSGYSERTNKNTGNIRNDYLYSVRVPREKWQKINFNNLGAIDVVSCFEEFDLRRSANKQGVITPVEPFDK